MTAEELEEIKRAEVETKMKKEAAERAELERQEAEEAEVRSKRHEEWVCMKHILKRVQFFYVAYNLSTPLNCTAEIVLINVVYKIGRSLLSLSLSAFVCTGLRLLCCLCKRRQPQSELNLQSCDSDRLT